MTSPSPVARPAGYGELTSRTRFVRFMLYFGIAFDVLAILVMFATMPFTRDLAVGNDLGSEFADTMVVAQTVIGGLQMVVYLVTAIGFLTWMHRAYKNLPSLQAASLSYTPGWAVGAWFVPIMNLFRPLQIVREIWQHSGGKPVSLGLWWATWIASNVTNQISFRIYMGTNDPGLWVFADWMALLAGVVGIGSALLLIQIVTSIDVGQDNKSRGLTVDSVFG